MEPELPPAPLILTLGLDAESQARFEAERRRHYPARLNRIPAHLSLFHALPGEEEPSIRATLSEVASAAPFPVEVHDLMRLGRGVAYSVHAAQLDRIHARLRAAWLPWLTAQDRRGFRPHIVIQNKVDPAEARALYGRLSESFRPFTAQAGGLLLWHYQGGPWVLAAEFPFATGL